MSKIFSFFVTTFLAAIYYYFALPAINFQSVEFIIFLIIYFGLMFLLERVMNSSWFSKLTGFLCIFFVLFLIVGVVGGMPVFQARSYQRLITAENANFEEDISQIEMDQIPILDRESAERLGDRRMGEMLEYVSQFEVSNEYTQINFCERPIRVTPLEYGDIIKWVKNLENHVPAYIKVDMVTQNVTVVKLNQGMKYVPSGFLWEDLDRHLRFQYPTALFGKRTFEIDDDGNPWYVVPVLQKKVFLFGGSDVKGIVLMNPIDGTHTYYDVKEVPTWIDRVYPETMITKHLNWYGQYAKGWLNSWLGQTGVLNCTQGYNYLALDDDIWLYTGYTSKGKDESNVGFMLVNLRTKQTKYYICPGAEEYSAMESAQGAVDNFGYRATFPLLINVNNEATYITSLKDSSSLVKMYALINVRNYEKVAVGTTLQETFQNYAKLMGNSQLLFEASEIIEKVGKIAKIKEAVKNGNTYYYMQFGDENVYVASIEISDLLPIVEVNDNVAIRYGESQGLVKPVVNFMLVE